MARAPRYTDAECTLFTALYSSGIPYKRILPHFPGRTIFGLKYLRDALHLPVWRNFAGSRTVHISVYFTPTMRDQFRTIAKASHLHPAQYIRELVLRRDRQTQSTSMTHYIIGVVGIGVIIGWIWFRPR